jgi:hypothetical protein
MSAMAPLEVKPLDPKAIAILQAMRDSVEIAQAGWSSSPRKTATSDCGLFTVAADDAVRSLNEEGGALLDLEATVNEQAGKWSLRATPRLGSPEDAIELEVAG